MAQWVKPNTNDLEFHHFDYGALMQSTLPHSTGLAVISFAFPPDNWFTPEAPKMLTFELTFD